MALTWQPATIVDSHVWSPGLYTLRLDVTADFAAGQFLNLTCEPDGGRHTRRAYSVASAPGAPLEFFIVEVAEGRVSPTLCGRSVGDTLYTSTRGKGLFTLAEVPAGRELWMFATGTGLAPFLSMIREGSVFDTQERVVVVYGVRQAEHLAYLDELAAHPAAAEGRLIVQPLVSREAGGDGILAGRMTDRLSDGGLEQAVGLTLGPARSHAMLCGNPAMIAEMSTLLAARGMERHTRRTPGHVTTEKYW